VLPHLDQHSYDHLHAEHLARFEAMQPLDQDKSFAVLPDMIVAPARR
jgi:hypothetical protein